MTVAVSPRAVGVRRDHARARGEIRERERSPARRGGGTPPTPSVPVATRIPGALIVQRVAALAPRASSPRSSRPRAACRCPSRRPCRAASTTVTVHGQRGRRAAPGSGSARRARRSPPASRASAARSARRAARSPGSSAYARLPGHSLGPVSRWPEIARSVTTVPARNFALPPERVDDASRAGRRARRRAATRAASTSASCCAGGGVARS